MSFLGLGKNGKPVRSADAKKHKPIFMQDL